MSAARPATPGRRVVAGLILGSTDPHARMQASLRLFQRGVDVRWIVPQDVEVVERCDALMVFGHPAHDAADGSLRLVRGFWQRGKSLAFFGCPPSLPLLASVLPPQAPRAAAGVVSDPQGPRSGALDAFVDAMAAQPHQSRFGNAPCRLQPGQT